MWPLGLSKLVLAHNLQSIKNIDNCRQTLVMQVMVAIIYC